MPTNKHLGMQRIFGEIVGCLHALETEGGALSMSAIAAAAGISTERAMFILTRLEEEGAVTSGSTGTYTRVTSHLPE